MRGPCHIRILSLTGQLQLTGPHLFPVLWVFHSELERPRRSLALPMFVVAEAGLALSLKTWTPLSCSQAVTLLSLLVSLLITSFQILH